MKSTRILNIYRGKFQYLPSQSPRFKIEDQGESIGGDLPKDTFALTRWGLNHEPYDSLLLLENWPQDHRFEILAPITKSLG